jgi:hypothetical protein
VGKTAIPKVKNVGKPCEGKLHARFDEEGLVNPALHSTISAFAYEWIQFEKINGRFSRYIEW